MPDWKIFNHEFSVEKKRKKRKSFVSCFSRFFSYFRWNKTCRLLEPSKVEFFASMREKTSAIDIAFQSIQIRLAHDLLIMRRKTPYTSVVKWNVAKILFFVSVQITRWIFSYQLRYHNCVHFVWKKAIQIIACTFTIVWKPWPTVCHLQPFKICLSTIQNWWFINWYVVRPSAVHFFSVQINWPCQKQDKKTIVCMKRYRVKKNFSVHIRQ